MRKISTCVILIIFFLSCNNKTNDVSVSGKIAGLGNDTIMLFGINELTDIAESIPVAEGKFSHKFSVDTITQAFLIINEMRCPVYFNKGDNITINGDISQPEYLQVEGNEINAALTGFYNSIRALDNPSDDTIEEYAENFIRQNQASLASIYLLDRYFVQKSEPDFYKIKELISIMDGTLQDALYITRINGLIEDAAKVEVNKMTPTFSFTDINGEKINRYDYRHKYLLLNFWASWCDSCKTANAELKSIYKKYKKEEKFAMIGVSLDMDKKAWKQTIKTDTLQWEQVSDMEGWGSSAIKQFNVLQIPYNILIDANGKIIERGITGEKLEDKLEELLKKEKK